MSALSGYRSLSGYRLMQSHDLADALKMKGLRWYTLLTCPRCVSLGSNVTSRVHMV